MDTINLGDDDFIASYRSSAHGSGNYLGGAEPRHRGFGHKKAKSRHLKLMNEILEGRHHDDSTFFPSANVSMDNSDDEGGAVLHQK